MKLTSPSFVPNGAIPAKFTCEGQDVSPALQWEAAPAGTKAFALVVDDPDAQSVAGKIWVHWVIANIPATTNALPEAVAKTDTVVALGGAVQGVNDFRRVGYGGPCPPPRHGVHHYHFQLYALDAVVNLPARATKKQLGEAITGHVLTQADLIGTYERK